MSHKCRSILIHCMDFRLIDKTREWMYNNKLIGDCDVVSVAGAGKEIADNANLGRELLLKQIATACSLHCANRIILLHHSDCGAYKNSYSFSTADEEKEKQSHDMTEASRIIKERFSSVEILKVWAQMKDAEGRNVEFVEL